MSKTYMDLNINERINIKSWWENGRTAHGEASVRHLL